MVSYDMNRLSPRQQAIWNRHAPDAFLKFDRFGIKHKDIRMAIENVNIERHMMYWKHRCNLCGDIVPKRDYTICDVCDKYATMHHFVGNIHFTIEDGPVGHSRVIFYKRGQKPSVPRHEHIPYNFY